MEIIVTGGNNYSPYFHNPVYEVNVTEHSPERVLDLSLRAEDPDFPSFGNGEIFFYKENESDMYSNATGPFITLAFMQFCKGQNQRFETLIRRYIKAVKIVCSSELKGVYIVI